MSMQQRFVKKLSTSLPFAGLAVESIKKAPDHF